VRDGSTTGRAIAMCERFVFTESCDFFCSSADKLILLSCDDTMKKIVWVLNCDLHYESIILNHIDLYIVKNGHEVYSKAVTSEHSCGHEDIVLCGKVIDLMVVTRRTLVVRGQRISGIPDAFTVVLKAGSIKIEGAFSDTENLYISARGKSITVRDCNAKMMNLTSRKVSVVSNSVKCLSINATVARIDVKNIETLDLEKCEKVEFLNGHDTLEYLYIPNYSLYEEIYTRPMNMLKGIVSNAEVGNELIRKQDLHMETIRREDAVCGILASMKCC